MRSKTIGVGSLRHGPMENLAILKKYPICTVSRWNFKKVTSLW